MAATRGEHVNGAVVESSFGISFVDLSQKYKVTDISDIGNCFVNLHKDLSKEFTKFSNQVAEIKTDIQDLKGEVELNAQDIEQVKSDSELYKTTIENLGKEVVAKDFWLRKWNLVFRGISGQMNENEAETEDKIRKFMKQQLAISDTKVDSMLFSAVHRLKSGPDLKKNIIVRFVNLHDKDLCMQAAFKLKKGCGFGVSQDLPPILAKQRMRLIDVKNNLSEEKKQKAKLTYLKVHPYLILKYPGGREEARIDYMLK